MWQHNDAGGFILPFIKTGTAQYKHLFTNLLYCDECNKGMWYKANQKGIDVKEI
ncbi:hypothetical protein [Neobacillus mesonae]|uniref:hypothetical protein n=1 Tax=Neobacillus mesonae TaxID=1193713 RepID=UPI000B2ECFED|nr:hypothetical protein [Neobacillus mesonae]